MAMCIFFLFFFSFSLFSISLSYCDNCLDRATILSLQIYFSFFVFFFFHLIYVIRRRSVQCDRDWSVCAHFEHGKGYVTYQFAAVLDAPKMCRECNVSARKLSYFLRIHEFAGSQFNSIILCSQLNYCNWQWWKWAERTLYTIFLCW